VSRVLGHIDPEALRIEALSADERAALAKEGYVTGADIAQPSVMPFNTRIAGAAVIELLRLSRRNGLANEEVCQTCGRRRSAA